MPVARPSPCCDSRPIELPCTAQTSRRLSSRRSRSSWRKQYSTDDSGRFVNGVLAAAFAAGACDYDRFALDREAGPVRPVRTKGTSAWPNENDLHRPPSGAFLLPGPRSWTPRTMRRAISAHRPRDHRAQPRPRRGRPGRAADRRRAAGHAPGCRPRGDRRRSTVPLGTLDVALYRDDIGIRPVLPEAPTDIPFDVNAPTSCWSTTCCSPAARSGPHSTH